jgi:enediyne polyketide synthase
MGNCGVGFAPCRPEDRDRIIELMEGVEDIPGTALHEGIPWTWVTFADYLDHLSTRVFDVDVAEPDGTLVARWERLRLRAISRPDRSPDLPSDLVGPWLTRRLIECEFAGAVELLTVTGTRRSGDSAEFLRRITGEPVWHDPTGAVRAAGHHASASYTEGKLLLAVANEPVGVDWESMPADPTRVGALPSDAGDRAVAELLADKLGEDPALARLRVWTAREAIGKVHLDQAEPLRADQVTEDGLAIMRSGSVEVATAKVRAGSAGEAPSRPLHLIAVARGQR